MVDINVDFEVFKELTIRRNSEDVTENEVIRELLGMKNEKGTEINGEHGIPWISKGVSFPHAAEFRTSYKGQQYFGSVQNGALVVNGKRYSSPSAAAFSITGSPVNGWCFWECLMPGTTKWKTATTFRK